MNAQRLTCKTCGSDSMVPMQVVFEHDEDSVSHLLGEEQESRFYNCQVCGDNWLCVKEKDTQGACRITFVHQMGMAPVLKRVAHLHTPVLVNPDTVDHWEYFLDEEPVEEAAWREALTDRRDVLKSVCTN